MDKQFFEEMRKVSHSDELRSRLLLHGMKRILEEKQEQKGKRRLLSFWNRNKAQREAEKHVSPWKQEEPDFRIKQNKPEAEEGQGRSLSF
ncbi:hypothetical protein [Paenibacillus sp. NEAU-GSW1]|uniref:hypothetical protein n=1 Tax=Paenibacillus sp. NEAU-GSW1 TaxID=2682486 RepID=UPI0012E2DACD|nr:hypothetical protein [Paenibacillus sp. NEAU-GSW1]MUT67609.1 hypothetical protein [Paenibacillus sp. NEAU-GSW1]